MPTYLRVSFSWGSSTCNRKSENGDLFYSFSRKICVLRIVLESFLLVQTKSNAKTIETRQLQNLFSSVHTITINQRFQKIPHRETFSEHLRFWCPETLFSRDRKAKTFPKISGYVWTGIVIPYKSHETIIKGVKQ